MKKTTLLFMLIFLSASHLYNQVLNQDADGKSSLMYSGGVLGFDVSKTEVSLSFNNHYRPTMKKCGFLWGVGAKGKTENGIAEIFNGGTFLPSGELSGVFGYINERFEKKQRNYPVRGRVFIDEKLFKNIKDIELKKIKYSADSLLIVYEKRKDELVKSLKRKELKEEPEKLDNIDFIRYILNQKKETTEDSITLNLLIELIEHADSSAIKINDKQREIVSVMLKSYETKRYVKDLFYFSPGIKGSEFDYFRDSSGSYLNYFDKKAAMTWSLMAGYNRQQGRWLWGISAGFEGTNNLSNLKTKDYNISTTEKDSITGETLSSSVKKTAYRLDEYYTYIRTNIFVDASYFMPLDPDGTSGTIIWNAYARLYIPTTFIGANPEKATMNLGISAYFLDGSRKFSGGVYAQVNDTWGARNQPGQAMPFYEKFSFGLVTRFNFAALLTYK